MGIFQITHDLMLYGSIIRQRCSRGLSRRCADLVIGGLNSGYSPPRPAWWRPVAWTVLRTSRSPLSSQTMFGLVRCDQTLPYDFPG